MIRAKVSSAHAIFLLLKNFAEEAREHLQQPKVDVLEDLALLFGLW